MSARDRLNGGWLFWWGGGLVAAVAVGWIAAKFHAAGVAPFGILPLGVGFALGALLSGLASILAATRRVAGRTRLIVGTLLLALVAVLAQHAWLYVDFRRQWHEARAKSPEAAMFRPETPWSPREYLAHEMMPQRAALWFADAAFITAAAVGTVVCWRRRSDRQQDTRVATDAAK